MKALVLILLAITLVGCGPSCEERGGKRVYSHTVFVYGKGTVVPIRKYTCEGANVRP